MKKRFKKFQELSVEEKKLFVEAYVYAGGYRMALLLFPFKWLTHALVQHPPSYRPLTLNTKKLAIATKVGRVVGMATANTPWQSACLVQSLTMHKMLKHRQISGVFYLGVKKLNSEMKAHAWTQCDSEILTGKQGHEAFTVISVFAW